MMIPWFSRPASADEPTLNLTVAGDLCAVRGFETRLLEAPLEEVFDPVLLDALRSADVSLVNVESVLTDSTDTELPGYALRSSPKLAPVFRAMGMTVAGLANNHIRDVKSRGVIDTIECLSRAGIDCVGAGADLAAAQRPWIREINGIKLGLYVIAEREFNVASPTRAGSSLFDPATLPGEIAEIKKRVDVLIVSIHAGHEFMLTPSPRIVSACRAAVEAGADAVIGHHPHVVQGIETHRGRPIVYSLGNFCFDSDYVSSYPHWETGFLACLRIGRSGVLAMELLPYEITRGERVVALNPAQSDRFAQWMRELSAILESDEAVRRAFRERAMERFQQNMLPFFTNLPRDLQGDKRAATAWRWLNTFNCPTALELYREIFGSYVEQFLPESGR
jgi:poly-gamma-glutamate synthesis protein (capsule biosynthesis protein)